MSAIVATLTSLPYTQYRRNRYFYVWYDSFFIVMCGALIALMVTSGWQGLYQSWDPKLLLWLPLAAQAQILCSVWIHNCTHNNFPRLINRIVGELCGIVVVTRFGPWEIIHQRHHKYSDDAELDPHPITPGHTGYWKYLLRTVIGVEEQLQKMFFEIHGDTPENHAFEKRRAVVSFAVSFLLLPTTWYFFLGAPLFVMLFVPAAVIGFFHLVHFNWSTHNPWSPNGDHRPVNLNSGFFKIGNLIWHGIYFHGNHHKKTSLFNPGDMREDKALPVIRPGDRTDHYPRKKTKRAA